MPEPSKPHTALRSERWDKLGTQNLAGGFAKRLVTYGFAKVGFTQGAITASAGCADASSVSQLRSERWIDSVLVAVDSVKNPVAKGKM